MTPTSKKTVLFVVHVNTFFSELFRTAKAAKDSGRYTPIFIFYPYPTIDGDLARCTIEGIAFDIFLNTTLPLGRPIRKLTRVLGLEFIWFILALLYEKRGAISFFRKHNPSLLIIGGDMVGRGTSTFIRVAKGIGLKSLIIPSTMSNGLEQAEVYFFDPRHQIHSFKSRIVGKFFPKWKYQHKGRALLRLTADEIIATEFLRLAPPLPWIFNSGDADQIAIESKAMFEYYLECGIPSQKMRITGGLSDDILAAIQREKESKKKLLYEILRLPPEQPLVLTALPPDSLYMLGGRPECDFKSYSDLVHYWVNSLASIKEYNIVVSLHPSVKLEDFRYIEDWGVKIAKENVAELIPLCDLYVASVSSTIRWAISCGIPVLNYDVYRYKYTDFKNVNGVILVEEKKDFESFLRKLTLDSVYKSKVTSDQQKVASFWGNLDQQSGVRIFNLFEELSQD